MNAIDEYLEVNNPTIFVLNKPPRESNGKIKDGLHIVMPDVVSTVKFHKFLRQTTYQTVYEILRPCGYINSANDIYDKSVTTNNWMMYGSNKPDEKDRWTLWKIYEYDNGQVKELDALFDDKDLVELLSIRNKFDAARIKMEIPDTDPDPPKPPANNRTFESESIVTGLTTLETESFETVKGLVAMLSQDRSDNYHDWIRLGWCLHNIGHGDINYLALWSDFSKKSAKYRHGECESQWQTMRYDGLNIGTLCRWAREDSPDEYDKVFEGTLFSLIVKSASGTHYDIAKVIHYMYKDTYACVVAGEKVVHYVFANHKWNEDPDWCTLKLEMSTTVVNQYTKVAKAMTSKATTNADEDQQKKAFDVAKRLTSIAIQLKSSPFKRNIKNECQDLFRRSFNEFYEKFNSKNHLLGFTNGVYDLDSKTFRAGHPEDLITYTTRYAFPTNSQPKIRAFLTKFIQSISSSQRTHKYLMETLAYASHGNKKFQDNNIIFWSGSGANGKSVLKNLCMTVFGEYAYEPDPSMITCGKTDSSRANPELAKVKGRRFVCTSEPESGQKLQVSLLKRMGGGDQLQARELFRNNVEFIPQCMLVVLMNNKPSLNDFDGGICRRLSVVDFPFKFVDKPIRDMEKPIDITLEHTFKTNIVYAQEFMLMLLENLPENSIHKPEEVLEETNSYLENNNLVKKFITEYLIITGNRDDMISSSEMFQLFQRSPHNNKNTIQWFKEQMKHNGLKAEKKTTRGAYYFNMVYFGVKEENRIETDELGE